MPDAKKRIQVDLDGRIALVTGGSRGLGRLIALDLAAAGAKVACVSSNPETFAKTAAAIQDAGGTAHPILADVTNSQRVDEVVDEVFKLWGGLDILVNNAGITRDGLIMRMRDEQWDDVLNVNLKGAFLFTRAASRRLCKSKFGRIINIASVSGLMGNPGQANYSASKAGMIGLTRAVARELAPRKVTVNAVAPGFIRTEMTAELGDELLAKIIEETPLQRLGLPQDVADAVLYLASDAAEFITGQVLTVDGGLTV
jgi:3-oxoacyl-[acyl-carrier protein] reductase